MRLRDISTAPPCTVPGCDGVQLAHRLADGSVRRWCEACQTRLEHLRALERAAPRPSPVVAVRRMGPTPRKRSAAASYVAVLPTDPAHAVTARQWAELAHVPVDRLRAFASATPRADLAKVRPPSGYGIRYWRREGAEARDVG